MQDLDQLIDVILTSLTEESYTPYQVSKELNKVLTSNGRKGIVPQMMYNYARNGILVKGQKLYGPDLRPITRVEVSHFIGRYMIKNNLEWVSTSNDVPSDQLSLF